MLINGNPSWAADPCIGSGILYCLTGQLGWAEIWRDTFFKYLDEIIGDTAKKPTGRAEFWTWQMVLLWDLLEESPAFDDEQRLTITNKLLTMVRRSSAIGYMIPENLPKGEVRWNHQTFNALGLLFGGAYFHKYYRLPEAKEWKERASLCFEGMRGAGRSWDEAGGYGAITPLHTLMYALFSGDMDLVRSKNIKDMAERSFMVHDPSGTLVGYGDGGGWPGKIRRGWSKEKVGRWIEQSRGSVFHLRFLEALGGLLGEGRYIWMWKRGGGRHKPFGSTPKEIVRLRKEWSLPPYASGIQPMPPKDHIGIRVIAPLDRKVYEVDVEDPKVAHERTVDKVAIREGLGPTSAYLLWDGYGGGRHGHMDSNSILRLSEHGRLWLADGGYNAESTARYHNGLVVIREGRVQEMPPLCSLRAAADLEGTAAGVLELPSYGGINWTRAVMRKKRRFFLIMDLARAAEEGEYDLRLIWRWLGEAEITRTGLSVSQTDAWAAQATTHADGRLSDELRFQVGRHPVWAAYPYASPVVRVFEQRLCGKMNQGEGRFRASLFVSSRKGPVKNYQAAPAGAGAAAPEETGIAVLKSPDGGKAVAGIGPCSIDGIETDAMAFLLESKKEWSVIKGRKVRVGDLLINSQKPLTFENNWETGFMQCIADSETEIEISSDSTEVSADGKKADAATGGGVVGLKIDQGEHTIRLGRRKFRSVPSLPVLKPSKPAIPGTDRKTGIMKPSWEQELPGRVTALDITPGLLACSAEKGNVQVFDHEGRTLWRRNVNAKVNQLSFADLDETCFDESGKQHLIIADEEKWVKCCSPSGKLLWSYRCPNGELGTVGRARLLKTVDLDKDGYPEILVGTAGWWVICLDRKGNELWRNSCYAHSALSLEAADLDGDGRIEVVQSNEYYFIHIISSTGKALASHYVHKWAPRVFPLLLSDIDSDGKKEIICGASDGKVRVFKWDPNITQGAERTFAPILNEVWSITLGGEVTCLAVLSDGSESPLIAAGSHGYRLTCIDASGTMVWDVDLGIAAEWIWPEKEGIYTLGGGNIFLVSRDGRLLKTWEAGGEITAAVRTDGRFFIGTKEGRILCFQAVCTAGAHPAKT